MSHTRLWMIFFLANMFLADNASHAETAPYDANEALIYKTVDAQPLHLYVYKPEGWAAGDRRPALIYIHGGGWVGGSPGMVLPTGIPLVKKGMVVFSVQYRHTQRGAKMDPAMCVEDAKSAVRYVRLHAGELGVDPDRIATGGSSAGGHLSAACAMLPAFDAPQDDLRISCKPNAMVLLQPVLDNGPDSGYAANAPAIQANLKMYSPAHNIQPGAPPSIVFGGREDRAAKAHLLEKFVAGMRAAGNDCELFMYDGEHGFVKKEPAQSDINLKIERFFERLHWLPIQTNSI